MIAIPRTDTSLLGQWWWTVDRWSIAALLLLAGLGAVMVMAASPPVAERLGLDRFHFVYRHLAMLAPALGIMLLVSLLSPTGLRRVALGLLLVGVALMVATLFVGVEVKGARRWLGFAGLSIQPSELVKPAFAVVTGWLFAVQRGRDPIAGNLIAGGLLLLVVGLLVRQPDFGMAVMVTAVWFTQFVMTGLPLRWIALLAGGGVTGLAAGYALLPHVQSRIDRFVDPAAGDHYQVDTALSAFANGGLFGRGPGEGVIKAMLPDAHADFIFAVAGEEFGLVCCLVIVALFAFIVLRGFARLLESEELFVLLAGAGLLAQFGLQAFINMAVALDLAPTKGMTLPFLSYGGSSLLGLAIAMGMLLALTRRHHGARVLS